MNLFWAILLLVLAGAILWIMIAAQDIFREQERERDDHDV